MVITGHSNVDYGSVLENAKVVVDTRNVFKDVKSDKLVRL